MSSKPDAFDTSVVVPALLAAHPMHAVSRSLVVRTLAGPTRPVLPSPVLVESFSVLTRMPGGLRAEVARDALLLAFRGRVTLVAVDDDVLWDALGTWPAVGAGGGRAYDAHVLACAQKGGAGRLWTFNVKHFRDLDLGPVEVLAPTPPEGSG